MVKKLLPFFTSFKRDIVMKIKFIPLLIITLFIINGCGQKKDNSSASAKQEYPSLRRGDYTVNISESKLIWTGKQVSTKQHNGTINIKKGKIIISDNGSINGDIEIDMSTINTIDLQGRGKDKLDGHLKSPDFFDITQHPVAYLKFQGNQKNYSNGKLKFDGELTIKNITHPISFYSKIENLSGNLSANADVIFDRSLYDVKFGSGKFFDNLGDRLIYDEINIDVLIVTI